LVFDREKPTYKEALAKMAEPKSSDAKPIRNNPVNLNRTALVFLDVNGHISTNTSWSEWFGVNDTLVSAPGNLTQAQVEEIISQAYIAFELLNVSFTSDETVFNKHRGRKLRAVFTTTDDWFEGGTGVASIGSMTQPNAEVYIFTNNLYFVTDYIHKILVHEVGHSLGLYHQSLYDGEVLVQRYRQGCKMGTHFNSVGLWIYGQTHHWTVWQDDIPTMASMVGYRRN
jgi:hypothetical protein